MKVFLIRHGETVDNVAGIYAGSTNSALTNHGVLQASKLGQYLATSGVKVTHIFSSDLQRAFKTAESVRIAQRNLYGDPKIATETKQFALIREQDLGWYEGKKYFDRAAASTKSGRELQFENHKDLPGFVDFETKESMTARADTFVNQNITELLVTVDDGYAIVIVGHGSINHRIWGSIRRLFPPRNISVAPDVGLADRGLSLDYLGSWMNTAYLELEIKQCAVIESPTLPAGGAEAPQTSSVDSSTPDNLLKTLKIANMTVVVRAVNSTEHLKGITKTRGGIGSSKHDEKQKTIETFFKKPPS